MQYMIYNIYHKSRVKPRMLTKTRRKDGSICHKHQNGEFDCSGSLPSTVMAIPKIESSEETTFKWNHLPMLIHSSGKTRFHLNSYSQIMENSSIIFSEILIFRVMSQTVLLENHPNFFEISILGSWARPFYWKIYPSKTWVPTHLLCLGLVFQ